jgi:ATP-dependent RNA helicase DeaD
MRLFYEMGLSRPLIKAIDEMGFEEATLIQQKTIPIAMAGRDVIGQAQTGTGKTAAFGIPMIERIEDDSDDIRGLVITPTRELAIQVAEELNRIGQFKRVRALPIYGGQDIKRQIKALKNRPQIIVGTPGRLMDHIRRKTLKLQQINTVVLDEADEMLSMGFIEDIETILNEVPKGIQTMLFSATIPNSVQNLAHRFLDKPEYIKAEVKGIVVPSISQYYVETQEKQKFDVLCMLLDIQSPDLCIIFVRTKKRADEINEMLNKRGYMAEAIHGDLPQAKRNSVLNRFKEGSIEILVATDVAARGLDISGVTHIYNFDIPQDPESYVHRIGRTGRAGKSGEAITIVTHRELGQLKTIERVTKGKIVRKPAPTIKEVIEGQQQVAVDRLLKAADQEDTLRYKELAQDLLNNNDSVSLLSAALRLLIKEPETTPVILTEEIRYRTAKNGSSKNRYPGKRKGYYSKNKKLKNKL